MKLNDRIMLGIVSGLAGNIAKITLMTFAKNMNWSEITGREKAAGMLIPTHQAYSRKGKIIGHVADNVVAITLGVGIVYMLSITGKDKAWLKGLASGEAMWAGIYGVLSTMGATRVNPLNTKTVLSELVGHSVFGVVTATTAAHFGNSVLFSGEKPLTASPLSKEPEDKSSKRHRGGLPNYDKSSQNERTIH